MQSLENTYFPSKISNFKNQNIERRLNKQRKIYEIKLWENILKHANIIDFGTPFGFQNLSQSEEKPYSFSPAKATMPKYEQKCAEMRK